MQEHINPDLLGNDIIIVEVTLRRIYGKERFYPYNDISKTLCKMIGSPTLTKEMLLILKEDGWKVIVKTEEYKLE